MGSFNVSCGISRLSINCGDKCLILPLIVPKSYNSNLNKIVRSEYSVAPLTSMMLDPDEMYEPFCFPIRGEYNDYGSLENIEKDSNTDAIEKFMGMSIEDFVALITDTRRDVYDRFSSMYKVFFSDCELLGNDCSFSDFLLALDFVKNDNTYTINSKCSVVIEDDIKATFANGVVESYREYDKDDFLNDYLANVGEYLGVNPDNLEKMKLVNQLSGMFMLADVYDFYAYNQMSNKNIISNFKINEAFLAQIGFYFVDKDLKIMSNGEFKVSFDSCFPKIEGVEYFYGNVDEFISIYKDKTGRDIDLSPFLGVDSYDMLAQNLRFLLPKRVEKIIDNSKRYNSIMEDIDIINDIDDIVNAFSRKKRCNPFIDIDIEVLFKEAFIIDKYEYLSMIYIEGILKDKNIDDLASFLRFYNAMTLSNIPFMPTYCGTQCGCDEAEIKLSYIINYVVKKRSEKRKAWDDDYNEMNPLSGLDNLY